jgi:outer membrane protein
MVEHNRMVRAILLSAAVVGLLAGTWCRGAEQGAEDKKKPTIYLGGGTMVTSKPYKSVGTRLYPVPILAYEGKRLYVRGVAGGYRLFTGEGWSIGPVIQPRFDGYNEDDSPALAGMGRRDWSVDAGVGLSWLTGVGLFGLSYVTDLLGKHDGQEIEFSDTVLFKWMGFDVIPSAGIRWKTRSLVDYYYGVKPAEARVGRPAYEGDSALDPFARLALRRELSERWSLLTAVQYEWLDDEIADSPIVDADFDASFMVGVLYSW